MSTFIPVVLKIYKPSVMYVKRNNEEHTATKKLVFPLFIVYQKGFTYMFSAIDSLEN